MRIVTNSSPLIAFAVLERLEWLPLLFSEICIPPQVLAEISCWSKLVYYYCQIIKRAQEYPSAYKFWRP